MVMNCRGDSLPEKVMEIIVAIIVAYIGYLIIKALLGF